MCSLVHFLMLSEHGPAPITPTLNTPWDDVKMANSLQPFVIYLHLTPGALEHWSEASLSQPTQPSIHTPQDPSDLPEICLRQSRV